MRWKVAVVTVSDRGARGARDDISGNVLKQLVQRIHGEVIHYTVIADEQSLIEQTLLHLTDEARCDLILTTGGTGFAPRDVTPEATKAIIDKEASGLVELMRAETWAKTKFAALSRATAGIRSRTLIINLPGSPKGVEECFEAVEPILPHALSLIKGEDAHDE